MAETSNVHPPELASGALLLAVNKNGDALYVQKKTNPPTYLLRSGRPNTEGFYGLTLWNELDDRAKPKPVSKDAPWMQVEAPKQKPVPKAEKKAAPEPEKKAAKPAPVITVVPPPPPPKTPEPLQGDLLWLANEALLLGHVQMLTPEYGLWRELVIRSQKGALNEKDLGKFKIVTRQVVSPSLVGAMLRSAGLKKDADRARKMLMSDAAAVSATKPAQPVTVVQEMSGALDEVKKEAAKKGAVGHGPCSICGTEADLTYNVCDICLAGWMGGVQRQHRERLGG